MPKSQSKSVGQSRAWCQFRPLEAEVKMEWTDRRFIRGGAVRCRGVREQESADWDADLTPVKGDREKEKG